MPTKKTRGETLQRCLCRIPTSFCVCCAYYIPAITQKTDKRCLQLPSGGESCKVAIQTNNVEVDDRGFIYIVDRVNTGMHILELTGAARKIANFGRPPSN